MFNCIKMIQRFLCIKKKKRNSFNIMEVTMNKPKQSKSSFN